MLTVAKFPHACGAMLLDEPCCKATNSALIFFLYFSFLLVLLFFCFWGSVVKYAEM